MNGMLGLKSEYIKHNNPKTKWVRFSGTPCIYFRMELFVRNSQGVLFVSNSEAVLFDSTCVICYSNHKMVSFVSVGKSQVQTNLHNQNSSQPQPNQTKIGVDTNNNNNDSLKDYQISFY